MTNLTIDDAVHFIKSIEQVQLGVTNRIELYNGAIKIYRVANIVRVDIKDAPKS